METIGELFMSEIYVVPGLLVDQPQMPAMLKKVCADAAEKGLGFTVPQFLCELEDADLLVWLELAAQAQTDHPLLIAMSLFCALMATSEGLVVQDFDNLSVFVTRVTLMAQAELLTRQGLLALDPATLTLEEFDPTRVPRTTRGQTLISEIKVVRLPPPAV